MDYKLYSFDVFDTLITRKVAVPVGVFDLMQRLLVEDNAYAFIPAELREDFAAVRIKAESAARDKYCDRAVEDVSLEQIYSVVSVEHDLSSSAIECLIALEKRTELECVVPIDENIGYVKSLLSAGKRVVLISDMYLDETTIRSMLLRADEVFADVPIYVSSEYKKLKGSGRLFEAVHSRERVDYSEWQHVGDNERSDVEAASELGIHAERFCYPKLFGIEREFLNRYYAEPFVQYAIGAARNIRLKNKNASEAFKFGCSIAAPILFAFVSWMLKQCSEKGIRKLYFVARDGFVPKQIADKLIEAWGIDIETKYIYGSRRAWRSAAFENRPNLVRELFASRLQIITSVQFLMDLFELDYDELKQFLPDISREQNFSLWQARLYCRQLNNDEAFNRFLVSKHAEKRRLAKKYLRQELGDNCQNFDGAFVDTIGSGHMMMSLANLLGFDELNKMNVFAIHSGAGNLSRNCVFHNFGSKFELIWESMTRATHEQTAGYTEQDGKVIPVFIGIEGAKLIRYGYGDYIDGVNAFCEALSKIYSEPKEFINAEMLKYITELILKNMDAPELRFLADLPWDIGVFGKAEKTLAPRLSRRDIRNIYFLHRDEPLKDFYKGVSLSYSELRCTPADKLKINFYETNRQRIFDRYKRLYGSALLPPPMRIYSTKNFSARR